MTTDLILVLLTFQIKHFLCDYLFQTRYMLGKFKPFPDYILPLAAHSAVNGIGTFIVFKFFINEPYITSLISLAALDVVSHFFIDRIKASPKLLGRFKPHQPAFWWALGFDQMLHQIVYLLLASYSLRYMVF